MNGEKGGILSNENLQFPIPRAVLEPYIREAL